MGWCSDLGGRDGRGRVKGSCSLGRLGDFADESFAG